MVLAAVCASGLIGPSTSQAVTRPQLEAYTTAVEQSWGLVTDDLGAVADPLQPERGRFN